MPRVCREFWWWDDVFIPLYNTFFIMTSLRDIKKQDAASYITFCSQSYSSDARLYLQTNSVVASLFLLEFNFLLNSNNYQPKYDFFFSMCSAL